MLFPSVTGLHRSGQMAAHPLDEMKPSLDVFYSASHEKLRFLTEYFAAPDHHTIERMQIGWLPTPSSTLWMGRFHNPLGYWNTQFHHGSYLTTAISRPGIVAFEKYGGVLPMHISGLLLEGSTGTPMNYSLSLGIGPKLKATGLKAVDILNPTEVHGQLAASGKLTYQPTAGSTDELGLFAARTRIPAENLFMTVTMTPVVTTRPIYAVTQTLVGVEMNREFDKLRLISELYIVQNRVETSIGSESHIFTSGYLQAEYSIRPEWTLFGRLEDTAGVKGDTYLALRPNFVQSRTATGARLALSHQQALKFEVSHSIHQNNTPSTQLGLEWSAIFP